MADVQLENGYLKIANELYEALCKLHLSGYENQVLRAVIRLTYGYNRKSAEIDLKKFQELTGIKQTSRISEAIIHLLAMNIIRKSGGQRGKFSINKHYNRWKTSLFLDESLRKSVNRVYGKPETSLRKSVNSPDELKNIFKNNIKYKKERENSGFQPISFYTDQFLKEVKQENSQ